MKNTTEYENNLNNTSEKEIISIKDKIKEKKNLIEAKKSELDFITVKISN